MKHRFGFIEDKINPTFDDSLILYASTYSEGRIKLRHKFYVSFYIFHNLKLYEVITDRELIGFETFEDISLSNEQSYINWVNPKKLEFDFMIEHNPNYFIIDIEKVMLNRGEYSQFEMDIIEKYMKISDRDSKLNKI